MISNFGSQITPTKWVPRTSGNVCKYKQSRKSIQKLLRHKKESTTERYLHQIHSDLKDIAGMAVPKEKVHISGTHKNKGINDDSR